MAGARKPCRGYDGAARPRPGPDAHRPRAEPFRGGRHGDADLARVGHGQPGGGDAPPLQEGHGVDGLRCRGQGDAEEGRPWAIMGAAGRRHQFGRAVPPGPRCDGSRRSRPESPRRPSQGVTGAFTFPQVYGLLGRPLRPCLFNVGVQEPRTCKTAGPRSPSPSPPPPGAWHRGPPRRRCRASWRRSRGRGCCSLS